MNTPAIPPSNEPIPFQPKDERAAAPFVQPTDRMVTSWLTPTNLEGAMKIAEFMSKASLLPQAMQGNLGNCMLVLSQAARWRMDPFAVAQAAAVVRGKLCFEGKLVAAALVATGAVRDGLDYEFEGAGQDMSITVTGVIARSGKTRVYRGSVKQLRTDNENWTKDPQSMLVYRASRQWARLYAPEVMLGVVTEDEAQDFKEAEGTVTNTERPSVVPETKAPKKRAEKEPAPAAPAPPAESAAVDPRHAELKKVAEDFAENFGNAAVAELRAINAQLGVKRLQDAPVDKLDDALALVRKAVAAFNGSEGAAP